MTTLYNLDLEKTRITDAGLEKLGPTRLSGLNLKGTRVTKEGLDRLKKIAPQINVFGAE